MSFSEEDKFNVYSKVLAKYFLAEGIFSKHKTLLASLDDDPQDMVRIELNKTYSQNRLNHNSHFSTKKCLVPARNRSRRTLLKIQMT